MHGEKKGAVSGFVQQTHTNIVFTLSTHFGKKRDCLILVKHVFSVNRLCLETKQMWLKHFVARYGDPCLKPRSFSQPQIIFQQFCFHEIRLTDKMLQCT